MAKITKGSDFGGCVRYVMTKKDAKLIVANGVFYANRHTITESFEAQAAMNPRLGRKVGHISLNFSAQNKDKIDNAFMVKIAREYMQKMKIIDTPYIVVRHNDREHPHCHIVFSRVDNQGQTISDQNDRLRSVKACRALTEQNGLYLKETNAKQNVKREQLRGPDKVKYEIYDAVKAALPHCKSWSDLRKRLEKDGISITYKFKGSTDQKEGVIFSKDNLSFNGSKVDRQFSFSKLDAALNANAQKQSRPSIQQAPVAQPEKPQHSGHSHSPSHSGDGFNLGGLLDITPGPAYDENEAEFNRQQRKKKKKSRGRSMG